MVSRKRTLGCLIASGGLLCVATLALLLRHRPQQMVEAALTDGVGAPVQLGRLVPLGLERWRLERIRVEEPPAWPWIDVLTIETLEAEGALRDVLAGRFREIAAHGVSIRTRTPVRAAIQPPPSALRIERLVVAASWLSTEARDGRSATSVALGAELFAIGVAPHGRVHFDAPSFAPRPWLRFFDRLPAGYPQGDRPSSCSPAPAHAELVLAAEADGGQRIEIVAGLPWTEQAQMTLHRKESLTTHFSLAIDGIEPLCWLPPMEGLDFTGTVDVAADRSASTEPTTLRVTGALEDLTWQRAGGQTDLRGDTLRLSIETSIPPAADPVASVEGPPGEHSGVYASGGKANATGVPGSIAARASIEGLRGRLAGRSLSPGTLPTRADPISATRIEASLDGRLHSQDEVRVDGQWTVRLGTFATLHAQGAVWRKHREKWPVASLDWSLEEIATEPVVAWLSEQMPGYAVGLDGIRGAGQLEAGLNRPKVTATVTVDRPTVSPAASPWQLRTDRLTTRLWLTADSEQRAIEVDEATWSLEDQEPRDPARVRFTFPLSGRYQRHDSAVALPTRQPARETVAASLGKLGTVRGTRALGEGFAVAVEDASLSAWVDLLSASIGETAPAGRDADRALALSGELRALLEVATDPGEPGIRGSVTLEDAGFQSADGTRAAEGLTATAQVAVLPTSGGHRLRMNGSLDGPALLWETLFADFSGVPVAFDVDAHWVGPAHPKTRGTSRFRAWTLTAGFTPTVESGGLRLALEASQLSEQEANLDLVVLIDDLSQAYEKLVRQPFAGSSPRIEGLRLAGSGAAQLTATRGSTGHRLAGQLTLERVKVATAADTLVIEGLGLDLPFDWTQPNAPRPTAGAQAGPSGSAKSGRLTFDRLTVAGVRFANVDTPLAVDEDSIHLAKPLTTAVAGGTVGFQNLAFRHLLTADRELATAISLRGLDLGQLTRALELPPLAGRLDGEVPSIRLRSPRFEVEGEASLQLFGGTVRLFDIAGRDFFSPFPRVTFSADLGGLDLLQLTAAFEFGRMAGRVDGTLRQCTLVGAQPVACAAQVESRAGAGIPRWIDFEAVNNLSVLGTGGGLQQGLARRFLRRFTYDKLGLSVRLADDRFLLRGLVHKRDREYFLKGRLPFPIDIVNAAPGSSVSFESMLDRIRNLDQARLTRGRSQPED